jgi:hypothetical protein
MPIRTRKVSLPEKLQVEKLPQLFPSAAVAEKKIQPGRRPSTRCTNRTRSMHGGQISWLKAAHPENTES